MVTMPGCESMPAERASRNRRSRSRARSCALVTSPSRMVLMATGRPMFGIDGVVHDAHGAAPQFAGRSCTGRSVHRLLSYQVIRAPRGSHATSTTASVIWPRYFPSLITSAAMANRGVAARQLARDREMERPRALAAGPGPRTPARPARCCHSAGATSATSIFIGAGL